MEDELEDSGLQRLTPEVSDDGFVELPCIATSANF